MSQPPPSTGTDTTRKFYTCKVNNVTFESIPGGHRKVAIKKVAQTFKDLTDAKRILRELKLLRHLGGHENISWILDIMVSPNRRNFRDVYIVTDFMETDLQHIISSPQTLSDSHIKYFVYQILRGLKYVHSANVLHRDLKPSNILVNSNCELVICDFGLARGVEDMEHEELTQYVVTRWYRAPELLSLSKRYNAAIDVWSVGCILAELLGRRPLFPGQHYIHQLEVIVNIMGTPAAEDMEFLTSKQARRVIVKQGHKKKVPLNTLYPHANPLAIDLLEKMLAFNPKKRISVLDALAHPYLEDYHFPDDEPVAPRKADISFEKVGEFTKQELQALMLREMAHFHPRNNEKLRMSSSTGRPLLSAAQKAEIKAKLEAERRAAAAAHASAPGSSAPRVGASAGAGAAGAGASTASAGAGAGGGGAGAQPDVAARAATASSGAVDLSATAELEQAREAAMAQIAADRRNARAMAGLAAISGQDKHTRGGATASNAAGGSPTGTDPTHGSGSNNADIAAITATAVQTAVEKQLQTFWDRVSRHVETSFERLEAKLTTRLDRMESVVSQVQQRVQRLEAGSAASAPRLPAASRPSHMRG